MLDSADLSIQTPVEKGIPSGMGGEDRNREVAATGEGFNNSSLLTVAPANQTIFSNTYQADTSYVLPLPPSSSARAVHSSIPGTGI